MTKREPQSQQRKAWLAGALLTALVGLALLWFPLRLWLPLSEKLERLSYDLPFQAQQSLPPEVVIISIGPSTLSTLGTTAGGALPRSHYAQLLNRLAGSGASLVVFDILFPKAGDDPADDLAFAQAMSHCTNVVLAAEVDQSRHGRVLEQSRVDPPLPLLDDAALGWGLATLDTDGDEVVRRLFAGRNGYPSLAWAAARMLVATNLPEDASSFPPAWLNYYGAPHFTFLNYNLEDVVREDGVSLSEFKDKVVFIGWRAPSNSLQGGLDTFDTPMGIMPGVEIHATTLVNLLRGDWLRRMNPWWERTLVLLAGLLLGAGLARLQPWHAAWVGALSLVLIMMAGVWSHLSHRTWFAWSIPAFAQVPLALAWSVGFQYVSEALKRGRLGKVAGASLTPRWARMIEDGTLIPRPGGEEKEATVMFTDLEGFAKLSEPLTPAQMSAVMHDYFDQMTLHVEATNGEVLKYMGDALMVSWGALEARPDHAEQAVRAAWLMSMAGKRDIAGRRFRTRFGINTGVALCGFVGGEKRFEYSVVGNATNVAARLEQLNKTLGTDLLIGGETQARLGGSFRTRALGRWRLRGLEQLTEVHEVLGLASEEAPSVQGWLTAFEEGLAAWTMGDFVAAKECFVHADQLREGGDGPSRFFLKRMAHYQARPPAWDGTVPASVD